MSELSGQDEREYAALADRAERGELAPTGQALHGEDAAAAARALLMEAAGADAGR